MAKYEGAINDILRENALVGVDENDAIDYSLHRCRESLLQLGRQFNSDRAYRLAALLETADDLTSWEQEEKERSTHGGYTEEEAKKLSGKGDAAAVEN